MTRYYTRCRFDHRWVLVEPEDFSLAERYMHLSPAAAEANGLRLLILDSGRLTKKATMPNLADTLTLEEAEAIDQAWGHATDKQWESESPKLDPPHGGYPDPSPASNDHIDLREDAA